MSGSNPIRWLDDAAYPLTPDERDALGAYAHVGPSGEQSARMWRVLQGATQPTPSQRLGSGRRRWWWGGALGIAAGLAWWSLASRSAPAVPALPVQQASRAIPSADHSAPAPSASAVVPLAPPASQAPLPSSAVQSGSQRVRPAQRARPPAAAEEAPDPGAELALLSPARQVMAIHPARALALADEHARRFPRGLFAEERAFLRVEALHRLGRTELASREAARFRTQYPGSTYLERLRQLSHSAP